MKYDEKNIHLDYKAVKGDLAKLLVLLVLIAIGTSIFYKVNIEKNTLQNIVMRLK